MVRAASTRPAASATAFARVIRLRAAPRIKHPAQAATKPPENVLVHAHSGPNSITASKPPSNAHTGGAHARSIQYVREQNAAPLKRTPAQALPKIVLPINSANPCPIG